MTAWFAGSAGWFPEPARRPLLVAGLLLVHAGLLGWLGIRQSPTAHEPAHLVAGISYWKFGNFRLYRVNPPLARMVAAAPVLAAGAETDWSSWQEGIGMRREWALGENFLAANGRRSFFLFTLARWALIPFSVLGGYIAYRWSADLFGPRAAIAALVLWCFSPNILAYGALITPDAAAASMGLAAGYFFWRWLRAPGWDSALAAGAVLALAPLTKSTWIVLFALWPTLWCFWIASGRGKEVFPACRRAAQLASIIVLALYVLNLGYGFEGFGKRLGDFRFVSAALGGEGVARGESPLGNRFQDTWLGPVPVPLPANYLSGIDLQRKDLEHGKPSYLRGQWRHGGWWYYYLYGLAVKVPLGTLGLMLVAAGLRLFDARSRGRWRDQVVLLAPAVAVLVLVSSQTSFSHYVRYVLPALPFVLVWISSVAELIRHRKAALVVAGLLAWSVGSSVWFYPHSMSYFNELAGGPTGGHRHLVDANIDWGQDLLYLKRWLDDHPEARPLHLAYFGIVDPRLAGIGFTLPPRGGDALQQLPGSDWEQVGPVSGWHAVSVNFLRGYRHLVPDGRGGRVFLDQPSYSYFLRFEPVAMAGYSIYIYNITLEEANRVRREMGLEEVPSSERGVSGSAECGTRNAE